MQAKSAFPRDKTVASLQDRAEEAASNMKQLDDFVSNRIDADRAALVGYLFVKELKKKSGALQQSDGLIWTKGTRLKNRLRSTLKCRLI